ncbi:MAG TPA: hypothetical protein VIZ18_11255 [Ktedonobacteraceae bacterium]
MTTNDDRQLKKTIPYGYASLVWNPRTRNLVMTLSLTGLVPGSVHSAYIRRGNCAEAGPVVYPLRDVLADGHGNAFTTTTIAGVATGIPASGWYIDVHNDPGMATPEQVVPAYCGNIINASPNTNHTQIIKVRLA